MARIRSELLTKRFEMLCRDLGWRVADHSKTTTEWEGCYTIQQPWHIVRYVGTGGGERRVADVMTRAELLAWIEGAEAAVRALKSK
jgi:hypothetical protein